MKVWAWFLGMVDCQVDAHPRGLILCGEQLQVRVHFLLCFLDVSGWMNSVLMSMSTWKLKMWPCLDKGSL